MGRSHRLGRRGEDMAAAHLRSRGWQILDRNWRFHHKELDLVVERDGVVAFVEVKTRAEGAWGHPLESITRGKRRDLAIAARAWVGLRGQVGQSYRFDAVAVTREGDRLRVEHIEGAWRL